MLFTNAEFTGVGAHVYRLAFWKLSVSPPFAESLSYAEDDAERERERERERESERINTCRSYGKPGRVQES